MLSTIDSPAKKLKEAGHTIIPLEVGKSFPFLLPAAQVAVQFAMMDSKPPAFPTIHKGAESLVMKVQNSIQPQELLAAMAPSLRSLMKANAQREMIADEVRRVFFDSQLDALVMPLHETTALWISIMRHCLSEVRIAIIHSSVTAMNMYQSHMYLGMGIRCPFENRDAECIRF